MRTEHTIRPVLAAGLGVFVLSCMDAVMKIVSAAYPIGQVVGLRYGAGAFFAAIAFAATRTALPGVAAVRRNLLRAVVVLCTAACFFTAIARLPLAQAIALTFMAPLLMAVMGRVILKETISRRAVLGITVGFAGVVVIARGQWREGGDAFDALGIAAALACAFFYALSMVLIRLQSSKDSTISIVAVSNVLAFILVVPVMLWQWQPVPNAHLALFGLAGLLGTLGHLCLAWAYSRANAAKLGILEYTAFLWGSALGFMVFHEIPTLWTVSGATLIILACGFATFGREKVGGPVLSEELGQ